MTKCRRCAEGVPHEFNHGISGYTHHGCRCDVCVTAQREYQREYQKRDHVRDRRREYAREYGNSPSRDRVAENVARKDAEADRGRSGQWTDAEVKVLMSNLHLPYREIGCLLGRSRCSVKNKIQRMVITQ